MNGTARILVVLLAALVLATAGCWEGGFTGGGDAGSDADSDSDGDTDADTDSDTYTDTDTDTDTDADTDFCLPEEVRQPETELCWLRCPLGQTWNGSSCDGSKDSMDWCDASGENAPDCSPDNPGQDICELSAGAGYRLPTAEEYSVLLEESGLGNQDGKDCDGDDGDTMCTEMFGYDAEYYWSATPYDSNFAWYAHFDYGNVYNAIVYYDYDVRCVRSGP